MKLHLIIHVSLLLLFAEIFLVVVTWDSNKSECYDNLHRNERRVERHSISVLNAANNKELTVVSSNIQNDLKLIKSDVQDKNKNKSRD